jgi:transitional endoplasmic reticulum ATPase
MDGDSAIQLKVAATAVEDAGRGVGRIDPLMLLSLGSSTGSFFAINGRRNGYVRTPPQHLRSWDGELLLIESTTRANTGVAEGALVVVAVHALAKLALSLRIKKQSAFGPEVLRRNLEGVPLAIGDRCRLPLTNRQEAKLHLFAVEPDGPCLIDDFTEFNETENPVGKGAPAADGPQYKDLGSLLRVVDGVREVVEWPMRHRGVFAHLGIAPPKGIWLDGPTGTGKTTIARAVAAETKSYFQTVNAAEIVDKFYGGSKQQLRNTFETARKPATSIIFIDEIDAILQNRDMLSGEKQVEHRIVAQLLTLMDGLAERGEVMVFAATNLPGGIDPALRHPCRFDREIRVDPPDREGRREILAVHTRTMPSDRDVNLSKLASPTNGDVGADIAVLCREAAMSALRRGGEIAVGKTPQGASIFVAAHDWEAAPREVTPTVLREVFIEIPEAHSAAVAGIDQLRERLVRAVHLPLGESARFTRLGVQPPRGVLLQGRPAPGKTLVARALATQAQAGFISVRGPEMPAERLGASERVLREIFARARLAAPWVIFFNEIDAVAGRRGSGDGATVERLVAQLLTKMDGITPPRGVVVLAATNRVDLIDPALPRSDRFDIVLDRALPDTVSRRSIFAIGSRCRRGRSCGANRGLRGCRHSRNLPAGCAGCVGPRARGE